jgi:transcriptional regulator with XRE-family HTH domain
MKTNLGKSLMSYLSRTNQTQWTLAGLAGITHTALSRIISQDRRPDPKTIKQLCLAIPRPDGAEVLCGHLRDEIERCGFLQREVTVVSKLRGEQIDIEAIDRIQDRLAAVARRRRDVRELLIALADVCDGLDETQAPDMLRAAEVSGTEYATQNNIPPAPEAAKLETVKPSKYPRNTAKPNGAHGHQK